MSDLIIPGAHLRLLPEGDGLYGDDQPKIKPTQIIWHTAIDGAGTTTLYNYWMGVNLESHGYVTMPGTIEQYMLLNVRADANNKANRRADGTGAISFETWDGAASYGEVRPWNDAQLDAIIWVTRLLCDRFGIPKHLPGSWTAPGVGYHNRFPEWSVGGTSCPSNVRRDQLINVVLPAINSSTPSAPVHRKAPDMLSMTRTNDGRIVEFLARPEDGIILHRWQKEPNKGQIEWRVLVGANGRGLAQPGAFDSVVASTNLDGRLEIVAWHSFYKALYRSYQLAAGGNWSEFHRV